jgi:hypothetical protein
MACFLAALPESSLSIDGYRRIRRVASADLEVKSILIDSNGRPIDIRHPTSIVRHSLHPARGGSKDGRHHNHETGRVGFSVAKSGFSVCCDCGPGLRGACHRARIRAARWLDPGYRPSYPTSGKSVRHLLAFQLWHVQPFGKKIFSVFQNFYLLHDPNHLYIPCHPVPFRGALRNVISAGRGCGGRGWRL